MTLSFSQLQNFSTWANEVLHGAQLQNIWSSQDTLILDFYKFRNFSLVLDANLTKPFVGLLDFSPQFLKQVKPLGVFMQSHFKNLRFDKVIVDSEKGRVLEIQFLVQDEVKKLTFIMIPRATNLIAESGDKKISWNKPKDLAPVNQEFQQAEVVEGINWADVAVEWYEAKTTKPKAATPQQDPAKILAKKEKALEALRAQLLSEDNQHYRDLGDLLKAHMETPAELKEYYNGKESISWNIEHCFSKAKQLEQKKQGTLDRIKVIESEIEKIKSGELSGASPQKSHDLYRKEKVEIKVRKIQLDEQAEAYVGKNAKENLELLRRAKPWDLWLHLKDYPSAHAVIFKSKNKNITREQIFEVAQFIVAKSLVNESVGSRYDIVVVECKHVRPIKGDKIGRVTYHNAQVYTYASAL